MIVLVLLYWERSTVLVEIKLPVLQAIPTLVAQPPTSSANLFQQHHATMAKLAHAPISAECVRALVSLSSSLEIGTEYARSIALIERLASSQAQTWIS